MSLAHQIDKHDLEVSVTDIRSIVDERMRIAKPIEPYLVRQLLNRLARTVKALDESVLIQGAYAQELNTLDGGRRMAFADGDSWMRRLENKDRTK